MGENEMGLTRSDEISVQDWVTGDGLLREKISWQSGDRSDDHDSVHVAFGVGGHYVKGLGITIFSLIEHNPGCRFHFHILTMGLENADIQRLHSFVTQNDGISITLYLLNDVLSSSVQSSKRWPISVYYRLIAPTLLRGLTSRVLYLDSDILCINSIGSLISQDLDGAIVAAVKDPELTREKQCRFLNLSSGEYFNSGVLLIDLEAWLANDVSCRVLSLLDNRGDDFTFPDQDAINVLLEYRIAALPNRFNTYCDIWEDSTKDVDLESFPPDTVFVHYIGRVKPWFVSGRHRLFESYYSRSPWRDVPFEPLGDYKEEKFFAKVLWKNRKYFESLTHFWAYIRKKYFTQ